MMKLARLIVIMFLVASWAVAQSAAPAAADDKGKKDASATAEHKHGEQAAMSCGCCKDMAKKDGMKADAKDASKAGDKDAGKSEAKSEAKSEGGMMAGGMDCCAKMGKDKEAAGGGMSCGKKDDAAKAETPEQKMK
jgi:hypothetical protein